ncbi:MAG: tetratricopeptide repeat protein [bacterium]|nr:tetratricopeptide repeat protein [bacterium]
MKKQNKSQEKKMKVAEAGILMTLVLGLTIFLGVHFSGNNDEITTVTPEPAPEETVIAEEEVPAVEPIEVTVIEPVTPPAEEPVEIIEEPAPEPRVVTYSMAEQAFFDGDFDQAADMFEQYTDEHSANAWGHYMLGLSYMKAGVPDVAEESFLAALDLKPDHQKSLVNYGRVLIKLERPEEARQQIEIALAVNPENNSALRVLGRIQHNSGQLEDAATTYKVVLRSKQDDAWALNNLGLIRIEQERYADAVAPLAKAVSLKSDVAFIQNNLGVALERTGQIDLASEAFANALAADADYEKAEISLARLEDQIQDESVETMDLMALAASFIVEEETEVAFVSEEATSEEAITEDAEAVDMEVAAIGATFLGFDFGSKEEAAEVTEEPSTTENVDPEADGHRNR